MWIRRTGFDSRKYPKCSVRLTARTATFRVVNTSSILVRSTKNIWEDNGGCLPALDAGGRRFESYFPDYAGMAELAYATDLGSVF